MEEKDFVKKREEYQLQKEGEVQAMSPSNIALIKYWGKTEPQIPLNPSLSYTLTKSFTQTQLQFNQKEKEDTQKIEVFLDGVEQESFVPKIKQFIDRIKNYVPFLLEYNLTLQTKNSFPHSSGIASSASGMSALADCFVQIEENFGVTYSEPEKLRRISFLARLGSGSACRSVYPGLVEWGESNFINESSNLYAVPYTEPIDEVFTQFRDTILLIHEGEKSVSSTVGHNLMNNHPYAEQRFVEANRNLGKMKNILAEGNLQAFGELVEHEALSLHGMMMTSSPAFILMKPNTVEVLHRIWKYRQNTNAHLYFTLDAGANVHLLYPTFDKEKIEPFIKSDLLRFCQNGKAVWDKAQFN